MYRDQSERTRGACVAAACDEDTAGAVEGRHAGGPVDVRKHGVGRSTAAVRRDRAFVGGRKRVRCGELLARSAIPEGVEQRPVRRLRTVPEGTAQTVEQDDRSPLREGRGVAPETHGVPEAGGRSGDGVERLARDVAAVPRQRNNDRVERVGEACATQRDAAQQGLGMSNCRGAGEDTGGGKLTAQSLEAVFAQRSGKRVEEPSQR